MECTRYLDCLAADYARLRAVVGADPHSTVPTCPGWTLTDLTRHVAEVYLHKVRGMREGTEPTDWPPKGLEGEEPLALLDRTYAELVDEFAARKPEESTGTWYKPDQTVGFWIRRMAQETVIHRIDAELGAGQPVTAVPDDLALDGIDELLKVFVTFGVAEYGAYFTGVLDASPGRTFLIKPDGGAWLVRTGPGVFTVEDGAGVTASDVTVSGSPEAVLRWVWNRETTGNPSGATVDGPAEAVAELRTCVAIATQ